MESHNSSWDHDNMTVAYDNMTVDNNNMTVAYDNMTVDYDISYFEKLFMSSRVMTYIIISSSVPLCAVAVYVLYSLVRRDGKQAPVFVINLLISDFLQICCLIVSIPLDSIKHQGHTLWSIVVYIYIFCLLVSTAFMACIALERYLLVVWPLWYRFKRSTRTSVVVSVLVWILWAVFYGGALLALPVLGLIILNILFLLPIPLFIFCLAATLRALSACHLPADEKRRIVAVLVLVLLIYILLFLPVVIIQVEGTQLIFYNLPFILLKLNPLADFVLYVFMQKGAVDKLLASVCCCKLNGGDSSISSP
ncbi:uncharacterized protein V6R79_005048 [Siganus canaliculatus]